MYLEPSSNNRRTEQRVLERHTCAHYSTTSAEAVLRVLIGKQEEGVVGSFVGKVVEVVAGMVVDMVEEAAPDMVEVGTHHQGQWW